MCKYLGCVFFLFGFYIAATCSQESVIDSLLTRMKIEESKHTLVDIQNELAWQYKEFDLQKAGKYALEANKLAVSINDPGREATSLNRMAEVSRLNGDFKYAISCMNKALEIERKIKHQYGIARALSLLTTLHKNIGQYRQALIYGKESLDVFIKMDRKSSVLRAYQRLAFVYDQMEDYPSVIQVLTKKLALESSLNDQSSMANTLISLGSVYYSIGSLNQSLDHFKKSEAICLADQDTIKLASVYTHMGNVYLELSNFDLAKQQNLQSIELQKQKNRPLLNAVNFHNLGLIHEREGDHASAKFNYEKSIQLKRKADDVSGLAMSLFNLANIFKRTNEIDSAKRYYEEILYLNPEVPSLLMETYWNLTDILSIQLKFEEANIYRSEYRILRDSLNSIAKDAIQAKDDFQWFRQESELLRKDILFKETILKKNNTIIYSLLGGILLLVTLGFSFFYNYRLRNKTIIFNKNLKIKQKEIDELLKNNEIKEMGALLAGQEKERKRIAQDLHDRLGSMLSIVKMHFKSVEDEIRDLKLANKQQYENANSILDEACEEVRKISHDMVSGTLYKFGLHKALESLKDSINQTSQLKVDFITTGIGEDRFEYDLEINIYRIIQELLSNVLKHAQAKEVTVQLIRKNDILNVQVEDDGIGFDHNEIPNGIGLKNVHARVSKLDGEMNIDTGKGVGTLVNIEIST